MKTIGLIGGMSWESTSQYYKRINQLVSERLGGFHSARCAVYSVDFAEIEAMQSAGDWTAAAAAMVEAGLALQRAGADFLVLCTNTMHKLAPALEQSVSIPLLHIADAAGEAVAAAGMGCVGLLGTRFTMEEDFYRARLSDRFGLQVLVPEKDARADVDRIIYSELVHGDIRAGSRARYLEIMDGLAARGAQGVILGCTEIGLLVTPRDTSVPLFDTTEIHARAAVRWALDELARSGL